MTDFLDGLADLRLLQPSMLALGVLVLLAPLLRQLGGRPRVWFAPAALLSGPAMPGGATTVAPSPPLPRSWRQRARFGARLLQIAGLLLVTVAMARPAQRVPLPREIVGIDIVLCIDVSSSMSATDLAADASRLDLAKIAAADFVAGRPDDRFGVVRFARYPDVVCPPTLDHRAVADLLGAIELVEPDREEDLTGIGTAVARAAQVLRSSESGSKVVILLTDGEETVATADAPDEIGPLRAARLCEAFGVRVYTIAVGTGVRTRGGESVPLDTTQVRRLAEITGGAFYEARDAGAVGAVYATIDGLERARFAEPRFELRERFQPFLIAALLLLLIARLARTTWLGVLP